MLRDRKPADQQTAQTRPNSATFFAFANDYRSLFGLREPVQELREASTFIDDLGRSHIRFEQVYSGIPILGAQIVAQFSTAGSLLSVYGGYIQTPAGVSTVPAVTESTARDLAKQAVVSEAEDLIVSAIQLVIDPGSELDEPRLAWKLYLDGKMTESWVVVVDAQDSQILRQYQRAFTSSASGSGIDLSGISRPLNLWLEGGQYYMVDVTKPMFINGSDPPDPTTTNGAIIVGDAQNTDDTAYHVQSSAPSGPWLADAVSGSFNLSRAYDYFRARHGRNSPDNENANLIGIVRYGSSYDNAAYFPGIKMLVFGDAQPYIGSLNIVTHEVAHIVISESAGLQYLNQSGALHESIADIFAEMSEVQSNGTPDWVIGSELPTTHRRSLSNPSVFQYAPGNPYPTTMSEYVYTQDDNGGVHINSSIMNHAFYLLASGLPGAIGTRDAERIIYRAVTTKLTPLSNFIDMRIACIDSAKELFGAGSSQAQKTAEAFQAVEIFDVPVNPSPQSFPPVSAPDSTVFVR